jgi:hypothetical protein
VLALATPGLPAAPKRLAHRPSAASRQLTPFKPNGPGSTLSTK